MLRQLRTLLILLFTLPFFALAETADNVENTAEQTEQNVAYVTDKLFIYLHSGPSREYRILGSVSAGSRFAILEQNTESKFTQIEDEKGRQGWIESRFVSDQPGLDAQLAELQNTIAETQQTASTKDQTISALEQQISQIQNQQTRYQQTIKQLKAESTRHKQALEEAEQAAASSSIKEKLEWLAVGGGIMFVGVLLGYILKRPRKSSYGYGDL